MTHASRNLLCLRSSKTKCDAFLEVKLLAETPVWSEKLGTSWGVILLINDLHEAVEFSSVHHFADDTNPILTDKSMKKIDKHINRSLKLVAEWIRANRLSLNTSKTELVIFKPKNKIITKYLNYRIRGQKIKPSSQVKYLRIILKDDLDWNSHLTKLIKKLSRSIGLLSKVRYYVPKHFLRTIYHSIFNSHLIYASEIWTESQKKLLL